MFKATLAHFNVDEEIFPLNFAMYISLHHRWYKETVEEQSLSVTNRSIKYVIFCLFHLSLGIVQEEEPQCWIEASVQLAMKVKERMGRNTDDCNKI